MAKRTTEDFEVTKNEAQRKCWPRRSSSIVPEKEMSYCWIMWSLIFVVEDGLEKLDRERLGERGVIRWFRRCDEDPLRSYCGLENVCVQVLRTEL